MKEENPKEEKIMITKKYIGLNEGQEETELEDRLYKNKDTWEDLGVP